jgi:ornithine cyclodeaminase/alanine dehydrogenase-like protein (mu-crystallin family)
MTNLPYLDQEALFRLVSWPAAIAALRSALDRGIDAGVARMQVPVTSGQLLLMPAESTTGVGVKVVTIAPNNPAAGRPRIQALYTLFDPVGLTPTLLIDGAALTTLRTPALSALAVDALAPPTASSLLVFGAGPQAWGHVHAIAAVRPIGPVIVVARSRPSADGLVTRLQAEGFDARAGSADGVAGVEIVVCATTARQPLFDGHELAEQACVVAIGSHEPDARELDETAFAQASLVVVEQRETALREAGDVIMAISSGAIRTEELIELAELRQRTPGPGRTVFKGVGMGWQDLAVAEAAYAACVSG